MTELITALVPYLVPIIGGIVGIFKSFKFVREGELGIKLRFGKAVRKEGHPKVIQPGFVLLIPFIETLIRRHVRQETIEFADLRQSLSIDAR